MDWQPIETAPMNVNVLFVCDNIMFVSTKNVVDVVVANNLSAAPTHWMPIPEPPGSDTANHPEIPDSSS